MKKLSITARLTVWYAVFMVVSFLLTWLLFEKSTDKAKEAYFRDELSEAISLSRENAFFENGYLDFEPLPDALDNLHVSYFTPDGGLLYGHICADTPLSPGKYTLAYDDFERHRAILDQEIEVSGYGKVIVRASVSMQDAENITGRVSRAALLLIPLTLIVSLLGGYILSRRAMNPVRKITETAKGITNGEDLKKRIPSTHQADEIGRLTGVINDMLSRLDGAFEREKQFTGDISHELRTPVSAILSASEAALLETSTEKDKESALTVIREKSISMGRMVNNLLLLSRMDAGKIALEMEESDLMDIAESALADAKNKYQKRDLTVNTHLKSAKAVCDPMLISCLITNLTENAFKYTKDGERIEIMTFEAQEGAVYIIENRGVGFEKDEAGRIFDRFYTLSGARSEGGNGLGLSICRAIATCHGADLFVDTEKDAYVRFTLILKKQI